MDTVEKQGKRDEQCSPHLKETGIIPFENVEENVKSKGVSPL